MEELDEKVVQYLTEEDEPSTSSGNGDDDIDDKITIDVFQTVFNLRKKRCEMVKYVKWNIYQIYYCQHRLKLQIKYNLNHIFQVQSAAQYEFLHRCVVDYAQEIEKKLQPPEDTESTPLVSYDKKNSLMTDLAVYENI